MARRSSVADHDFGIDSYQLASTPTPIETSLGEKKTPWRRSPAALLLSLVLSQAHSLPPPASEGSVNRVRPNRTSPYVTTSLFPYLFLFKTAEAPSAPRS